MNVIWNWKIVTNNELSNENDICEKICETKHEANFFIISLFCFLSKSD